MCNDTEEWWKIWGGIDLSFQNWHEEFDEFWPEHTKISKVSTFNEFLLTKAYTFELKKYRGVIFHDTEEWWKKIWRKPDLWFGKWHEKFGKFSLEHPKVIKLRPRLDLFIQSRKFLSWKFTEEFWIMARKNNAEFEKELNFLFKIDMRNLTNFDPSTHKFQKFSL